MLGTARRRSRRDPRLVQGLAEHSQEEFSRRLISTIRYSRQIIVGSASAALLLREARLRAGLSQVELASRAGVTQSMVSAYESGSRQPSWPTLARLVLATGFELDVRLRRAPSPLRSVCWSACCRGRLGRHQCSLGISGPEQLLILVEHKTIESRGQIEFTGRSDTSRDTCVSSPERLHDATVHKTSGQLNSISCNRLQAAGEVHRKAAVDYIDATIFLGRRRHNQSVHAVETGDRSE